MSTVLRFPVERARPPVTVEIVDQMGARPFHEVAAQAARMGAWVHYCSRRAKRVYIAHGHCCSVCGEGERS